jgi:hypothetical protein
MKTKLSFAKLDRRTLTCLKDGCSGEDVASDDLELSSASLEMRAITSRMNALR